MKNQHMHLLALWRRGCRCVAALLLSASFVTARADVKLPAVISDGMVIQRGLPVALWGWADPGEKVTLELVVTAPRADGSSSGFGEATTVTADADGKWSVTMGKFDSAGKPAKLTVKGKNTIVVNNILIGEVWLCSGQSNMEWRMTQINDSAAEIAAAEYEHIRLFNIPRVRAAKPQNDVNASWKPTTPQSVKDFSAVAYFFGRHLHKELDGVPIGLIKSAWGGTLIQPWTPPVGFESVDALKGERDKYQNLEQVEKLSHQAHTVLYNGMIHGVVPYTIRGAIWYQGESNRGNGLYYRDLMEGLITGWRKTWSIKGNEQFPFYFVQLAPYRYGGDRPDLLPLIWQAQTQAMQTIPNTGMAAIVDIGNTRDIHPTNKQDVGKRLALWALAKDYGKKTIVYSGPIYKSMKVDGDKARISFDHTGGGLVSRNDKPLTHFTIAGEDKKFVPARATIDGDTVVVESDGVKNPAAVRFGWHQEAEPNLSNKEGLPASPFRTDDWE